MKINLAKSAGFCFGVRRAFAIALKTARDRKKVFMLGEIVHNEDVARQIRKAGIKKITCLGEGCGKTLLLRAHGTRLKTLNEAKRRGYKIIDATCPMVKHIHRIVKEMDYKGYVIIVIGDKKHDEVYGITGQLKNKTIVIDPAQRIPFKKIKGIKKACIVVQSTQNEEKVFKIIGAVAPNFRELKFFNTICAPTKIKQKEIKEMPLGNDVMLIIGSKTSANTKRLYEISKSLNKNTYWVDKKEKITRRWFKNAKNVGISAGASTPDWIIKDICAYIAEF